ncbi:fumarylacetoacetate hydrolase family protein [Yinghuangia aomiensis]|uniref:Fumarylacetoacetate hydrolase family protein n=1 Tax=Yinghuangia aomiensis TaxID=676205 RepID=A0ABP9I590_9ACTN
MNPVAPVPSDVPFDVPFALATRRREDGGFEPLLAVDGVLVAVDPAATDAAADPARLRALGAQAYLDRWDTALDLLTAYVDRVRTAGVEDALWYRGPLAPGDTSLASPIPAPRQVLCAASNYAKHVSDFKGREDIDTFRGIDRSTMMPYLFPKGPDSVSGPYDDVAYPAVTARLDYEAELAVVLARGGRRVHPEKAGGHIAGYLAFNDLTSRDLQQRKDWPFFSTDWFAGKCFDGSAPMGPLLVPARFIPDYRALHLELRVNGDLRQSAPAGDMVFSVEEQIAFASGITALAPGDVIATGTPDGVAMKTGQWLHCGDVVETSVGPLGTQRVTIVEDRAASGDGFELAPPERTR